MITQITASTALRTWREAQRQANETVALVPTMGALHAGHMALVHAAKQQANRVVVSVFVNPTQFGPGEDFTAYPRTLEADLALLTEAGTDAVWLPTPAIMYPPGFATRVAVDGLSEGLCGAHRPGHFDGVALVVSKLLNQVQPTVALFGEKDYQQLLVIKRMAADLDLPVKIQGVPTVRDADGLALSSRNAYLSAAERTAAPALYRSLTNAAQALSTGAATDAVLNEARAHILDAGFAAVEYLGLCDAATLAPLPRASRPARLLTAARLGKARLIDNVPVAAAAEHEAGQPT